jgi:hypothetical protein
VLQKNQGFLQTWSLSCVSHSTGCSALQKKNGARYVKIDSILFLYTTVKLNSSFPSPCRKVGKKKGKRKTKSLPIYTCVKNVFFKFFDGHVFSSRVRCIEIEASLSLARVYTTQPICILHLNLSRNSIWEINLFTIQIWNYRNTLKIKINSQANIWI